MTANPTTQLIKRAETPVLTEVNTLLTNSCYYEKLSSKCILDAV